MKSEKVEWARTGLGESWKAEYADLAHFFTFPFYFSLSDNAPRPWGTRVSHEWIKGLRTGAAYVTDSIAFCAGLKRGKSTGK